MGTNVNTKNEKKQKAFQPFSWTPQERNNPELELLGFAKDVVGGVALAMQMMERSSLMRDRGEELLSVTECGIFERFTISACELLHAAVDRHLSRVNEEGGAQ